MAEIYDKVVSVRFAPVNKGYYFDANGYDPKVDDYVIVESIHGNQIGKVIKVVDDYVNQGEPLKTVVRMATAKDLVSRELFNQKKGEALEYARKRVKELNIKGVKILEAEFSFDGARLQITYSSENDEKVDLKALKYDLLRNYSGISAVDLRQLGPRDVAKNIAGMGACGLACRCCSRYLTEFSSISIKMAKEQGVSLTPAEITGMCGRLRCCLVYENEYYAECRKKLPKKNKHVMTPQGEGKVIEVYPLRESVLVDIPDNGRHEFPGDQVEIVDYVPEAKPKKDAAGSERPRRERPAKGEGGDADGRKEQREPRERRDRRDRKPREPRPEQRTEVNEAPAEQQSAPAVEQAPAAPVNEQQAPEAE